MQIDTSNIKIRERSWKAKLAARWLGVDNVAFTLGKTIHLYNATAQEFLHDTRWVKHELKHVEQFSRYGFIPFIARYTIEAIKKGYRNNKYEIEARMAEHDTG
ncbi:DUF4157 domain-containing protein [Agriterribacter sp.]|uniref:eCIS core domain-containing protein n=1 Tax=Agriterribacter sp. TaxID=2821509 RepID=UPI002C460F7B|nr:DUF4157 domain-containing protein [Agriterribacter sp.]HRP54812.1 DUF4157 domain-containing protein [Agriterribacter sp.]